MQRVPTRELELFIVRGFLDAADLRGAGRANRRAAAAVRDRRRPRDRQFPNQRNLRPRRARPGGRRGRPQESASCWACRRRPASRSRASAMRRARSSSRTPTRSSPADMISMSTPPTKGQRTWTAMVYLNQPEDGGATRFKTIGKTDPARDRQAAGVEQSAARRPAQPGHAPPGHESAPRDEICADRNGSGSWVRGTRWSAAPRFARALRRQGMPPACQRVSPLAYARALQLVGMPPACQRWSGRRDSNPRPQPWQGCALPLSYARSRADAGRNRALAGGGEAGA